MPKTYAVIFAGGTGSRMHSKDLPKQFLVIGGKPVIVHTVSIFQDSPEIEAIAISCHPDWLDYCQELVEKYHLTKVKIIVPGGTTGQDSIYNGLKALKDIDNSPSDDDIVLIHDGVRPLITTDTISNCIDSVIKNGPTATTAPATETVVVIEDGSVKSVVDRSKCQLARAPQGFRYSELIGAHEKARAEGFHDAIDSVSLMARYGYKTFVVPGPEENIKITTPRDFFAFKSFIDMKEVAQIWEP